MHELPVQVLDDLWVVQHDLRHERPGLEIAPALALEQVTLGTDDGSATQHCEQVRHAILQAGACPALGGLRLRKIPGAP